MKNQNIIRWIAAIIVAAPCLSCWCCAVSVITNAPRSGLIDIELREDPVDKAYREFLQEKDPVEQRRKFHRLQKELRKEYFDN